jgi:hypothetical protein
MREVWVAQVLVTISASCHLKPWHSERPSPTLDSPLQTDLGSSPASRTTPVSNQRSHLIRCWVSRATCAAASPSIAAAGPGQGIGRRRLLTHQQMPSPHKLAANRLADDGVFHHHLQSLTPCSGAHDQPHDRWSVSTSSSEHRIPVSRGILR